jgi:hypothetical protein
MVNSAETMQKKLFAAAIVAVALGVAACTGDDDPLVTPTPTPNPVTETFTGTLSLNGAFTHTFTATSSGTVRASIAKLEPDAAVIVGLSLGTWNGTTCQTIISNDNATVNSAVVGTADRQGRLCVRIYDATGLLPAPTDYELTVLRP